MAKIVVGSAPDIDKIVKDAHPVGKDGASVKVNGINHLLRGVNTHDQIRQKVLQILAMQTEGGVYAPL